MNQDVVARFMRSRLFAGIIATIGGLLLLSCVFEAGVYVGARQAQFSSQWGKNYERNFGGSSRFGSGMILVSHGALGKIVDISNSSSTLTIVGSNQQEQKVLIGKDTLIRDHMDNVSLSQLAIGTYVVVVGEPEDGQIEAKLIRIVPPPSGTGMKP